MNINTTNEVSTKVNKDSEAVSTNLTINWEGMEVADIQALAEQALIVKLQSSWRKNGIPDGDHTVKAVEHKVGVRAPRQPASIEALVAKLTPEARAELLAKLLG